MDYKTLENIAQSINSGKVNVFEENWEDNTVFQIEIITTLLKLLDIDKIEDTCDAIISEIEEKYLTAHTCAQIPVNSFYCTDDSTEYYLPQERDWPYYKEDIQQAARNIIERKQKAESYKAKIKQSIKKGEEIPLGLQEIVWDYRMLMEHKNPFKATPVFCPLKDGEIDEKIYFSEVDKCIYAPDVTKTPPQNESYKYLITVHPNIRSLFSNLLHAKQINGHEFTIQQVAAEWNYFVFLLSLIRNSPEIIERMGKPSKDENKLVQENINFCDGNYIDNELMKYKNLYHESHVNSEVYDDQEKAEIAVSQLEEEVKKLQKENEELRMKMEEQYNDSDEDDAISTEFTATPRQVILFFKEIGIDVTSSNVNKTALAKFLSKLIGKNVQNIYEKLRPNAIKEDKQTQKDLQIIKKIITDTRIKT